MRRSSHHDARIEYVYYDFISRQGFKPRIARNFVENIRDRVDNVKKQYPLLRLYILICTGVGMDGYCSQFGMCLRSACNASSIYCFKFFFWLNNNALVCCPSPKVAVIVNVVIIIIVIKIVITFKFIPRFPTSMTIPPLFFYSFHHLEYPPMTSHFPSDI